MIIAIIIGFFASFTAGVYTGATHSDVTHTQSATNATDKGASVPSESKPKKEEIPNIQNSILQVDTVAATATEPQTKTSKNVETALLPAPNWLKSSLKRARTDTSVLANPQAFLLENKLSADVNSATGDSKAGTPINVKNYVVQTKHQVMKRKFKDIIGIIQTLKYKYSLIGNHVSGKLDDTYIRVLGFTEKEKAIKISEILTYKTGIEFITLRISNAK
jgi:hypothetical protein